MNTIPLPALDGRLPLAFLTACGTARLLDTTNAPNTQRPRLSWDPLDGTARLTLDGDLDDVVERLESIVANITDSAAIPDGPPGFPPSKKMVGAPNNDPMRMPRDSFRTQVTIWREAYGAFTDTWIPALVTDLAADDHACLETTPFAAPSGQQTFSTTFNKALEAVRSRPGALHEALTSWRRVGGVTGEYLDHQVLRSAADRSEGESKEAGVPGATWLALMALPWFPVFASGDRSRAGGWQVPPGHRKPLWVWPLWSTPLDADGIVSLVAHPALEAGSAGRTGTPSIDLRRLRPLSVFLACAADRRRIRGRTFAGVLTPAELRLES